MGKQSSFEMTSVDNDDNPIRISCEGVDDNDLAHFGGLDLHVKAVKTLISNTDGMSFAEQEGDYLVKDKVIALYLNEIGQFIRGLSHIKRPDFSNMELVKEFLENWSDNKEVVDIVEQDNRKIQASEEATKKEEDEIWSNIMKKE